MMRSYRLKKCPFCGSSAKMHSFLRGVENAAAHYIECTNKLCAVTTNLRFSLMEDARPLLAEVWNRRTKPTRALKEDRDAE